MTTTLPRRSSRFRSVPSDVVVGDDFRRYLSPSVFDARFGFGAFMLMGL